MKQYVVKRFWGVEEIVVEAKNEEHAKEVADNHPHFSFPDLDYEEVELLSVKKENGKWVSTKIDNKKNRYAIEDDGYAVAEVVGETTANLMASAPDMLEALKEVHKWISLSEYEYNKHLVKVCEKAIAKAEAKLDPVTKTIRERQSRR